MRSYGPLLLLAVAAARWCCAGDVPAPTVDAIVPVPPEEHQRLHYFGRRYHHLIPGTVTIDRTAYECDVDRRRFTDRDEFVAHLVGAHRARPAEIPDRLLTRDGVVHFIGR